MTWPTARLGDVAELLNGDRGKNYPSQASRVERGIPFINAGHLVDGHIRFEDMDYITEEHFSRLGGGQVRENDILLCIRGSLGRVAIAGRGDVPAAIASSLMILRPKSAIDAAFLLFFLSSPEGQAMVAARDNGAAQPNVGARDVAELKVPLPPLSSQRKIAAFLSAYDELIENNRRRIRLLDRMAQAIYREWFVRFRYPGHEDGKFVDSRLGAIPADWTVARLGDVIELRYGKALKASARKGGSVAVVGSSGVVGWHNEPLISGPAVVVGRKGNVGSVIWVQGESWPIDTTYYVSTDLPLHFVYRLLREVEFIDSHAAIPGLSRDQAYMIKVLVPPDAIAARYAQTASELSALTSVLENQVSVLSSLRDALLPKLVSGAIDMPQLDLDGPLEESAA
jgi:type I restriction enzyme S subunit